MPGKGRLLPIVIWKKEKWKNWKKSVVIRAWTKGRKSDKEAKQNIEKAYDQLKSTQSQLIHAEKMASLGELTAGIAHEIQNPLNFLDSGFRRNDGKAEELTFYEFIMITGATFLSGYDGPIVNEMTGSIVIRPETLS